MGFTSSSKDIRRSFNLFRNRVDIHTAVSAQLSELIHLLTTSERETLSLESKEEMMEMYLVLGALLQWAYQVKIKA